MELHTSCSSKGARNKRASEIMLTPKGKRVLQFKNGAPGILLSKRNLQISCKMAQPDG
jgi:hypothetical protein